MKITFSFSPRTGNFTLPIVPPPLQNHGNYIISLNRFIALVRRAGGTERRRYVRRICRRGTADRRTTALSAFAPATKASTRTANRKANFEPGIDIRAKITILAEGARGSLTKQLIRKFNLDQGRNPQVYAVGVKEVWDVPKEKSTGGRVIHTMGWPLRNEEFGGGFIYNMADGRVSIGFVIGLDYLDPRLDPHERFQEFKTHPYIRSILEGGTLYSYGAKSHSRRRLLGAAAVLLQWRNDRRRCRRLSEFDAAEGNSSGIQERHACGRGGV